MPQQYLDKIKKKEVKNIQRKINQLNIQDNEILFMKFIWKKVFDV